MKTRLHRAALRRLAEEMLHASDLPDLTRALTQTLPAALEVEGAALLLWDRKLDAFEGLSVGEGSVHPLHPGEGGLQAPEARYLVSDGQVVETPGPGGPVGGSLVPLMARSGLVGMLVLGAQRHRRRLPFRPAEARLLSTIADRAALALENHLYQKELVASERMAALGTMAGMLAHDFRGPMTVIRGYAETLLEPGLPADEVRTRAQVIVESVDRLERMTGETLDFARGSGKLARRTVFVASLLRQLAEDLAQELPGLNVVSQVDVETTVAVALDVDKLHRAVSNIAANAADAMGGRGRLGLAGSIEPRIAGPADEAPRLVIVISDDGPGVADEVRDKLFQPFATFGKKKGTGLGLAVSRRFVEEHGGTLELLPNAPPPEHGARFRITLPLQGGEADPPR